MSESLGRLFVRVGADTKEYDRAMGGVVKSSKAVATEIKGNIAQAAKYSAAVTALGATIGTALVGQSLNAARETRNLAQVANASAKELNAMTFAARKFGIEQDKVADILKDFNDRIGDFNSTGAGPMVDFFEKVAPKVGVTAEQFERLSGPQALQLYVDSLEKANLSQADMTFYMETMASDATALLPLLRNGGEAMAEQAEMAERLGVAMDDIDYARMAEARDAISDAGSAFVGMRDQLAAELSPVITTVANQIVQQFGQAGTGMRSSIQIGVDAGVEGFARILEAAASTIEFIGANPTTAQFGVLGAVILGKKGALIGGAIGAAFDMIREQLADFGIGIGEGEDKARRLLGVQEQIAEQSALINKRMEVMGDSFSPDDAFVADALAQINELREVEAALQAEVETSSEAQAAFNELMSQAAGTNNGVAESLRNVAQSMRETRESQNEGTLTPPVLGPTFDNAANDEEDPEITAAQKKNERLLDIHQEYQQARQNSEENFGATMLQKSKAFAEAQKAIASSEAQAKRDIYSGMFGNLATLMQSEYKKEFEIGKAAAIAQAGVDGISAAVSSYKAGAAIGGPILGAAYAATSAVATGLQIRKLESASFGGGAAQPSSSPAPTPPPQQQQQQQSNVPQESGVERVLRLEQLDPSAFVSGAVVNQLAERLVEYQNDGFKLVS